TVFFDDEDRQMYLKLLSGYAQRYHLSIWAYCLMDNHIHILAVPETETALSQGIGFTNLMYTQYLNRKLKQSGRIWQNRFFSCVVESDQYLWSVARYIERNPMKVALAASAEFIAGPAPKRTLPVQTTHCWMQLHGCHPRNGVLMRSSLEMQMKKLTTPSAEPLEPDDHMKRNQFIDQLEFQLNQPVRPKKPGRPQKTGKCP
ncbi:transposase, partial [Pelotalea chapellei]